jgi:hypothetical protein
MQIEPTAQTVEEDRMEPQIEKHHREFEKQVRLLVCKPPDIGLYVLKHATP